MFTELAKYDKILVTGPSRSGTTICARAIVHDTGLEYVDENDIFVRNLEKVRELFGTRRRFVLQAPGVSRWCHEFNADLVVFMRRSIQDILNSQDRVLWTGEDLDLIDYGERKGPIAPIKYAFWEKEQKGSVKAWKEVEFDSLKAHPLFVEDRENFKIRQWEAFGKEKVQESFTPDPVRINLGSGPQKQNGYINIDISDRFDPDIVQDVLAGLPFEDSSVDEVRAFDFLEHIPVDKTIPLVEDIYRVLKPGGLFISFTPDAEYGQGAFMDPTHVNFWSEGRWLYFNHPAYRGLYGIKAVFRMLKVQRQLTDPANRIYHLHVIAEAVKEESNV